MVYIKVCHIYIFVLFLLILQKLFKSRENICLQVLQEKNMIMNKFIFRKRCIPAETKFKVIFSSN